MQEHAHVRCEVRGRGWASGPGTGREQVGDGGALACCCSNTHR